MKARVNICGRLLIMDMAELDAILELAYKNGEVLDEKWNSGVGGAKGYYTTHAYDIDPSKFHFNIDAISDDQYQMYKLAGKPE
jgi:hypothetical protein